jgi:hypothetical protein
VKSGIYRFCLSHLAHVCLRRLAYILDGKDFYSHGLRAYGVCLFVVRSVCVNNPSVSLWQGRRRPGISWHYNKEDYFVCDCFVYRERR